MALKVKVIGIEQSLNKIKTNFEKASKEIDAEMSAISESIVTTAKQLLPSDLGQLRSSLYKKGSNFHYEVGSNLYYAPYIEFGTGPYAKKYVPTLDKEWQVYAATFKKSKPGHSIQHPYFYPSIKSWLIVLRSNINQIIKKYER